MAATNTWGAGAGWHVPSYLPSDTSTQDMTSSDAFGDYADYTYKPQDARQQIGSEYASQPDAAVAPGLLNVPSNSSMAQEAGTAGNALGAMGGTAGAIGNGVGAVAGAYSNASEDTGSSVLSGAASGAAAGAAFGPWGMAIGAVVGGIAGFFGSKSKKAKAKKDFQKAEQLAILPEQQRQANWLQQQGLAQKAISNYKSGYTPSGFQFSNSLLGNPGGGPSTFKTPGPADLPNYNVAPPNVVPGSGDKSAGIAPNNVANNGLNTSSGMVPGGFVAPTSTIQQPATINAVAPKYSKDKSANNLNLNAYAKNYQAMIDQQNQRSAAAAMDPYKDFYGVPS